ncbi:MAG: chloride channel protein [Acidimicrobiaceae bacterium]|nr:chloride channel protein [Acidimicrobiaceae bacterium]
MARNSGRNSERQRVPQPLIKKRIASGRGAMEQPNVTHDGDAALTPVFWVAIVLTGVATGLFGAGLMALLQFVEKLAFSYHGGSYQAAVAATSNVHRLSTMVLAGVIGAIGWYLVRRYLKGEKAEIDDALWNGDGELSVRRSFATSVISEVVIGMGASIGREAAPKLMGGASASLLSHWFHLSSAQKRLLVACGGGAGLAAVYNVPLGGAIFTAEVMLGSFALPTVLTALACTLIATMTAWLFLGDRATYVDVTNYHLSGSIMVWSLVAGVIIGILAVGYVRLLGWVSATRTKSVNVFWQMPLAFAVVGVVGFKYPQLFGNGKDMAHDAFVGVGSLGLLFALFALKPLVTTLTVASGASGGVFTPFMATGAALGGFLGVAWNHLWPGSPVGAFALIGAAAMIGAAMQAPLAGLVLVIELTHTGFDLMVPMMLATTIATLIVRHIDGYSIYSARLPGHGE